MQKNESLTTSGAAKRLGVSLRTVQLWVESGALPAWKTPGGHRRIPVEAIEKVLANQTAAFARPLRIQPGGMEVLLVEDDPFQRELIAGMLKCSVPNLQLRTAEDGFEGLIRVGQRTPDVLIADIAMPGMDGLQMLRSLMARHEFNAVRVVVISGLSAEEIAARGGLPADAAFVAKPVQPEQLFFAMTGDLLIDTANVSAASSTSKKTSATEAAVATASTVSPTVPDGAGGTESVR
jgi:excisionase family DNA binding protein